MASLDLLILPKLEILELHHMHGTIGVAILVDQQIDKKSDPAQFYSFKDSTKIEKTI